jgi:ribose-phosphate pyrophosphokinase
MKKPIVFNIDCAPELAEKVRNALHGEEGVLDLRKFPDGEHYVRSKTPVLGRPVIVLADLSATRDNLLPTLFLGAALRELGAMRTLLVAPYLPYMRQDARFNPGEAVTSRYVARLISAHFDSLVTVDPHLHRYQSLRDVYAIQASVVHAMEAISAWSKANIEKPFFIGPDSESEQWVSSTANKVSAPYAVLTKTRHGDREVTVTGLEEAKLAGHTPVLLDDVISTGNTLCRILEQLKAKGSEPPVVVAVHGLFVEDALAKLRQAGAGKIVTSNTVVHETNAIDVSGPIVDACQRFVDQCVMIL